jgi:cytochrome c oxidase cbb3-type subunit 3
MSDFTNSYWSLFITTISLLGIVACLVLLWVTARKKSVGHADNTTGHIWDEDLREMNNPLPLWWVGLFVISVIFGLCYLWIFPGLGSFKGSQSWSSQAEYRTEMAEAEKALVPLYAAFDAAPVEQLVGDPKAMAVGERLFMNNCAQCHGSDGQGSKGFPNLTDADWLYGGDPSAIKTSITNGRQGIMPTMAQAVGSPKEISEVAHYVLSLSGSPHDSLKAASGKPKFAVCSSCHGIDGKGNQAMGAPNLTDKTWLHGWGEQSIVNMVNLGKVNAMPAQKDRLSESQIHVLTSYVWSLSHSTIATVKP